MRPHHSDDRSGLQGLRRRPGSARQTPGKARLDSLSTRKRARERRLCPVRAVDAIMECLKAEGVDTVFGIRGGAYLPTYDALYDAGIRHILCRHEQGAGHAAEGYAKASGKVGVALATSGPGATTLVTAIADAVMD